MVYLAKAGGVLTIVAFIALFFLGDGLGTASNAERSRGLTERGNADVTGPQVRLENQKPANLDKGMVSFNFDDGLVSAYTIAIPLLNAAGFKTSQYIVTQYMGAPGYITKDDILLLAAEGHEIGGHTQHHLKLTTIPRAEAKKEIEGSKRDLEAIGLKPTTFAYPQGDFNADVAALVKDAGFRGARTTHPLVNGLATDRFALLRQRVEADTTFEEIKKAIDQAQTQHAWVILVYHRIDEDGNPLSSRHEVLEQTIDYVKKVDIPVVTTEEGIDVLDVLLKK